MYISIYPQEVGASLKATLTFFIYFINMSIFEPRENLYPMEYPRCQDYVDWIRNSFWTHHHYDYSESVQSYKSSMNDSQRNIVKRCMLAISTIEVKVKSWWPDLYKTLPKPEINSVGVSFWFNETIHADFYSELLKRLSLMNDFETILEEPVIKERIEYIKESLKDKTKWREWFMKSLIFFWLFIENVSLFSQFLILMSYKHKANMLKWMYSWNLASSKEENLHAQFAAHIINTIKQEHPELWTDDLKKDIVIMCKKAYKSEEKIVDWIMESWELERLSKCQVKHYIKYRIDKWLKMIWIEPIYWVSSPWESKWFEDMLISTVSYDFFDGKSWNYSKNTKNFNEELF